MKSRLLILLLTATLATTFSLIGKDMSQSTDKALVHTVYFWLKDSATETDRTEFLKELEKLKAIEQIDHGWIGVPAATAARGVVDGSYDFSITFVFNSVAAEHEYQVHPIHKKFVETNENLWEKVQVYDAITP